MAYYTHYSSPTMSTGRTKLWDPSVTLNIINPDRDCLTCVGYAPSQGRRCRNPIRADNRALITRTLEEIKYMQPDSTAVMSRLRAIAGPALCIRYHQGQAETVVMEWQRKIQQIIPQVQERKPAKSVQSSRPQKSEQDRLIEDLQKQMMELQETIAMLQGFEKPRSVERSVKDRKEEQCSQQRSDERNREARRKETERLEKERLEKERLEKERLKKERLKKERLEKERLEKERLEKERLAKERREKEDNQRRKSQEAAASNERIRQRAQKLREDRERVKREKEQQEREEWDQLWIKYEESWIQLKASASDIREENIRVHVPWPVKSGLYRDVLYSNVKEFFQQAVSRDENMAKVMRKECLKWHPDTRRTWLRENVLSDVDSMMIEMICRVVTELLNASARRSSEFLG